MEAGDVLRSVNGRIFGFPMNVSFIDEHVCGTARMTSQREVRWLVKQKGVGAILSLTETPLPLSWIKDEDVKDYLHVAVRNHYPPTISQVDESVRFIMRNVDQERKVAVHCAAGQGRTGTILASYLCASKGISAKEAMKIVRAKRPGSIEKKSGQEEVIAEYQQLLEQRGGWNK